MPTHQIGFIADTNFNPELHLPTQASWANPVVSRIYPTSCPRLLSLAFLIHLCLFSTSLLSSATLVLCLLVQDHTSPPSGQDFPLQLLIFRPLFQLFTSALKSWVGKVAPGCFPILKKQGGTTWRYVFLFLCYLRDIQGRRESSLPPLATGGSAPQSQPVLTGFLKRKFGYLWCSGVTKAFQK